MEEVSLLELMDIFDNDDDDEDMLDPGWVDNMDFHHSAPVATNQVEILLGNEETKLKEVLDQALIELTIPLTETAYNEILTDLQNLTIEHSPRKMQQYYSKLVQKTYTNTENTPEIDIKRILRHCAPKIIKEHFTWKINTGSGTEIGLTDDDCKVIRYLCGAALKWGLKNFRGIDNVWCSNQVSNSSTLPQEFEIRNRGSLIAPVDKFFFLMKEVEYRYRLQFPTRYIDIRSILSKVDLVKYYPQTNPKPVQILIRKYIRGRTRMHCSTEQRKKLGKKVAKKKASTSKSFRNLLKQ